jgi:hypothetical protein
MAPGEAAQLPAQDVVAGQSLQVFAVRVIGLGIEPGVGRGGRRADLRIEIGRIVLLRPG